MNAESHVLRLGTKVHPYTFRWTVADSPYRKHAMNYSVDTLEISSGSLMILKTVIGRLMDSAPSKHGSLRVLFPNLKRVELYGYRDIDVDDNYLRDLREACLGSAADASVEVVLPSPPAPELVEDVS